MEKWIDKIFSLKTFPGKLIFVLWFSSVLLILLPENYLKRLSLSEFKISWSLYIGPVALVTTGILLWMVARHFNGRIVSKKLVKRRKEAIEESISSLNFNEIALLREFYLQANDTILIPFNNETVIALENKGIVYKATNSTIVGYDMGYPFSITNFAKNHLTPYRLSLPQYEDEWTEHKKRQISNERPDWAKEMLRKKELFRSIW